MLHHRMDGETPWETLAQLLPRSKCVGAQHVFVQFRHSSYDGGGGFDLVKDVSRESFFKIYLCYKLAPFVILSHFQGIHSKGSLPILSVLIMMPTQRDLRFS